MIVTQVPYLPGEARAGGGDRPAGRHRTTAPAGRFGVVLGPAGVLAGDSALSAERARAGLLSGDMVEAIIRLPGGLVPFRPGYETALWVLTRLTTPASAAGCSWRTCPTGS